MEMYNTAKFDHSSNNLSWDVALMERCPEQKNKQKKKTKKQEAQGLGALLDKMEDNDHINWITQRSRCIFRSKTRFLKIRNTPNDPRMTLTT